MISLRRSAVILMAVTVIGFAFSFVKEIVVAWYFGVGSAMDAYYAAVSLPNYLASMVGFSVIAVFVPAFIRLRSSDPAQASALARRVLLDVPVLLAMLAAVLCAAAGPILNLFFPGLLAETVALAVQMERWLAWSAVFMGSAAVFNGFVNAEGRFALPSLLGSIVTFATLAALALVGARLGVGALAVGLLAGTAVQAAALGLFLRARLPLSGHGRMSWGHPEFRALMPLIAASIGLYALVETNTLVDRLMASVLPAGSLATLGYSLKLIGVPQLVLSVPIATVAYPLIAERLAKGQQEELDEDFRKAVRLGYAVLLPATAFLILFAEPMISILFKRGRFDLEATRMVSGTLVGYAYGLPFHVPVLLLSRLAMVEGRMGLLLGIGAFGVALNVGLNWMLMRLWDPPVVGLCISTSIGMAMAVVFFFFTLRRHYRWLRWRALLAGAGTYLAMTGVLAAASQGAWWAAGRLGVTSPPLRLAMAAAVGLFAYAAAAHIFGLEEMARGRAYLARRIRGEERG